MQTDYEKLITHYTAGKRYDEQDRLRRSQEYSIEFLTTMHFLLKHLPKCCTVLDCCAAGGVYAFPLANEGYKVTAGDLVQDHVDALYAQNNTQNKNGLLEKVYQGDVLDMSNFSDESFDAVLCMGALYHLMQQDEREKCVANCLRVLKKGGIFAFAYVNRNAVYINHFNRDDYNIEKGKAILETGINGIFYTMGFNEPQELVCKFPLKKITDVGVDGLIYPLKTRLHEASSDEFSAYMEYHLATCEQPSIIGHSMHGLLIGEKRD